MSEIKSDFCKSRLDIKNQYKENVLMSDSFERLAKECNHIIKNISSLSNKKKAPHSPKNASYFVPLSRITFSFQNEALQLLSWLKFALKSMRSNQLTLDSVESILLYKKFITDFHAREPNFHNIHVFSDQLAILTRHPKQLSVSLPPFKETQFPPVFISSRSSLNRSVTILLRQVDTLWPRVGHCLNNRETIIDEAHLLSTLQKEITTVTSRFNILYINTFNNESSPTMQEIKLDHARLKLVSRRIQNAESLLALLQSGDPIWPALSSEGSQTLASMSTHLTDISGQLHALWLAQLEMRELFKMRKKTKSTPNSSTTASQRKSTVLTGKTEIRGACQLLQRHQTSKSVPCIRCLGASYERCNAGEGSAGGRVFESGFVSDSDTCHRTKIVLGCDINMPSTTSSGSLCTTNQNQRRWRALSFPPTNSAAQRLQTTLSEDNESLLHPRRHSIHSSSMENGENEETPIKVSRKQESPMDVSVAPNPIRRSLDFNASNEDNSPPRLRIPVEVASPIQPPSPQIFNCLSPKLAVTSLIHRSSSSSVFVTSSPAAISSTAQPWPLSDAAMTTESSSNIAMWDSTFSSTSSSCLNEGDGLSGAFEDNEDSAVISPRTALEDDFEEEGEGDGFGSLTTSHARRVAMSMPNLLGQDRQLFPGSCPVETDLSLELSAAESCNRETGSSACWSPFSGKSAELAELAAALRLPREASETLSRIFNEGSSVHTWLLSLEDAFYIPQPSSSNCNTPYSLTSDSQETKSTFSPSFCRLRHDIPRRELDKCLSELEFYNLRLDNCRSELIELSAIHEEKKALLNEVVEMRRNKLLVSGHGSLLFVSGWLDMLISRRKSVEQELNNQLRWLDYTASAHHDNHVRLAEVKNLAEPVLTEARDFVDCFLSSSHDECDKIEEIESANVSSVPSSFDSSCSDASPKKGGFSASYLDPLSKLFKGVLTAPHLANRLTDIIQNTNEIHVRSQLYRHRSIDLDSTNHKDYREVSNQCRLLQSRVKSILLSLVHSLAVKASHSDRVLNSEPLLNFTSPSTNQQSLWRQRLWNRKSLAIFILLLLLPLSCYLLTQRIRPADCRYSRGAWFEIFIHFKNSQSPVPI